jgi:cytochrome P450 family 144
VSAPPAASDWLTPELLEDPYPHFAWLRRCAPVHAIGTSRVFFVASWALVEEALACAAFSANLTGMLVRGENGEPEAFAFGGVGDANAVLATADPPPHDVHRRLVQPVLAAGRVAALEPELRERVVRRLAPFVAAGGGEWTAAVSDPIPSEVISRLLGFPEADLPDVMEWAMQGGAMLAGTLGAEALRGLMGATGRLGAYLTEHFAAARADVARRRGAPVLDAVLAGVEQGALTQGQALGIAVVLLVGAAGESTASLVGSAARLLAERPELQARLRGEPRWIANFIEEAVRLESPFRGHYRAVTKPVRFGGVALDAGDRLFLLWASANRDEARFEQPAALDLARRHPREHLGFGRGIHFCVGAALARLEARVILEELLARTRSFTLDPARPPKHVPSLFVRRLAQLPLRVAA